MSDVKVTVAICTWNRADLLMETLDRMTQLSVPQGVRWELLVVNNNCTDHTESVVNDFIPRLPLVPVFEKKQGLSNARNAALDQANGEYIIWTDDDVLVDEFWLSAYVKGFKRWSGVSVFGGKVLPWFENSPPRWLEDNIDLLGGYYALRDFGDREFVMNDSQFPYGANVAFKVETLRNTRFDPNLGRKGDNLAGGEETQVIRRLRSLGEAVVWLPESKVQHFLPKERMELSYLRKYHYFLGKSPSSKFDGEKKTKRKVPTWLIKQWLTSGLCYFLGRLTRRESTYWLSYMMEASRCKGKIDAIRTLEKLES